MAKKKESPVSKKEIKDEKKDLKLEQKNLADKICKLTGELVGGKIPKDQVKILQRQLDAMNVYVGILNERLR